MVGRKRKQNVKRHNGRIVAEKWKPYNGHGIVEGITGMLQRQDTLASLVLSGILKEHHRDAALKFGDLWQKLRVLYLDGAPITPKISRPERGYGHPGELDDDETKKALDIKKQYNATLKALGGYEYVVRRACLEDRFPVRMNRLTEGLQRLAEHFRVEQRAN
jgi:hypothetical protein